MAARNMLAIDVGHRDVYAVEAVVGQGQGRVQVVRVVHVQLPEEAREGTPESRGEHVRRLLDQAGIRADRAVWTLPRERAVFKRLDLPAAPTHELPEMVRLAMLRETSMGVEAVVDFVPAGSVVASPAASSAAAAVPGAAPTMSPGALWALGAPTDELETIRALARGARIGVERVALRTCGTAALLERMAEGDESIAAFDLAEESAELVAADGMGLRATRGTTLASRGVDAAVTEARRSWTALRMSQPELCLKRALLLGDEAALAPLAELLGTELPIAILSTHPDVDAGAHQLGATWPLVGLLLEAARKRDAIDLANPRRAPDMATRRRMRVYAVVAVVLLAYCSGWAIGKQDRSAMERHREDLVSKAASVRSEYQRARRDELKAVHLEAWAAQPPQWLDAMLHLHGFAPDPARVVLDSWSGQVEEMDVIVAKDGTMRLPPSVRISMDVETTDRASADALREALIARGEWTVKSTSSEGKAGRRLPVALELLLFAPNGTPVSATVTEGGRR